MRRCHLDINAKTWGEGLPWNMLAGISSTSLIRWKTPQFLRSVWHSSSCTATSLFNGIISEICSCRSVCEQGGKTPILGKVLWHLPGGERVSGCWWEWWLLVTAGFLITVIRRKDSSAKCTGKKKFESRAQHLSSPRQMKCRKGSPPSLDTRSLIQTAVGPLQWLLHRLWRCKAKAPMNTSDCWLAACISSSSLEKSLGAGSKILLGERWDRGMKEMSKQPLRERKEWWEHLCFGFLAVPGSGSVSFIVWRERAEPGDWSVLCCIEELRVLPLYKLLEIVF